MVKDLGNALTDLKIEREVNMGARCIHFNMIHFLGKDPTKNPVVGRGCLDSPATTDPVWAQPLQHSTDGCPLPDPLLSASDPGPVGAFLRQDSRSSEEHQESPRAGKEDSMPHSHWGNLGEPISSKPHFSSKRSVILAVTNDREGERHTGNWIQVRTRRPRTVHRSLQFLLVSYKFEKPVRSWKTGT